MKYKMVQFKKSLMFVMFIAFAVFATVFTANATEKFNLEQVEVDGHRMTTGDTLEVQNGDVLDVELKLESLVSSDGNRIRVWLNGYEHDSLLDSVGPFEGHQGNIFYKNLKVELPRDMKSQEEYTLRISIDGVQNDTEYRLYVDTERHRVDVLDLIMTPSYGVEAGQNVIAEVRLKNRGQKDQESVKVSISIPELGVVGSGYISDLDETESISSDEILLFIPETAEAGEYEVLVEAKFNDGYSKEKATYKLNVLGQKEVMEKSLIASLSKNINLKAGESSNFDVIIANPNTESKPVSIVAVENAWGYVEVTPSLAMIEGGSDATYNVKVIAKEEITGEKVLSLQVKEGTKVISELKVNAYVEKAEGTNFVNLALAALLIIAIIVLVSLMISIGRRKKGSNDDYSSNEEYY